MVFDCKFFSADILALFRLALRCIAPGKGPKRPPAPPASRNDGIVRQIVILALVFAALLPVATARAQSPTLAERLGRAAALIRDNKLAEADHQLTLILKMQPGQADALNLLGTIRAQQGRLDEAERLLNGAVQSNGQLVGAHMNLAALYYLRGKTARTIAELQQVIRLDQKNVEAIYKLARLQFSEHSIDETIKVVESAKQSLQPAPPFLLTLLGDAYLLKPNVDRAEENYLLALNEESNSIDALLGLAQVSSSRHDTETQSAYMAKARQLAASSPDTLFKFGVTAMKLGEFEEARAALEQAVKLNPAEAAYFIALGDVWLKKPDIFEAERAFRQALNLQPDNAKAELYLGFALLQQKKYEEARGYLERSSKGEPTAPEPLYYLGLIAQAESHDDVALQSFQKAVQLSASYAEAHSALGATYLRMKDYSRAQQELETAVKLNPNESKTHYQLALLYARMKDPKRAQEEMGIVEKLDSANKQKATSSAPPP